MPVLLFHWMLEVIDRLILQSSTCVSCIFVSRSTRLLSLRSGNQWSWYSRVHCATAKAQTLLRDTSAILVAKQPPSVSNCQKFSYKYLNWPWSKRIGFSHFKTWLLPWFSVVFPWFPWFFLRFPMVFPSHFAPKDLATYDLVHLRRHGLDGLAGARAKRRWRSRGGRRCGSASGWIRWGRWGRRGPWSLGIIPSKPWWFWDWTQI